jgi:SsrA-binding protein
MADEINIRNPKARFDYRVEQTFEAGIVLLGTEVKAIRDGKVRLLDAYVDIENGEVWVKQMWIGNAANVGSFPHEEVRHRKLLLSRPEIAKIVKEVSRQGYSVVPLRVYRAPGGKIKMEIALAEGKSNVDKKRVIQEREAKRQIERIKKGARE